TIGGLLVLLVAAVLIVPGLIDWNHYKGDIQAQAKNATGRDLAINGDIKITVLPAPALIAKDVQLTNIAGASTPHMARLNLLEVRIALAPLLTGRVEVKRIKLVDPVIELEVLGDGRRNWTFDGAGEGTPPATAGPSAPDGKAPRSAPPVTLDSFTIDNGTLVYRDARNGTVERIDRINANVAAASLNGPFESTGDLRARGVPIAYEVNVGDIIHGRTVPFSLKLGVEPGNTTLQMSGTVVGLAGEPKIKGKLKGEGESLAGIIHAVRPGMTVAGPLAQAFSFEGALAATATSAEVKSLAFRLGNAQAGGDLAVEYTDKLAVAARIAANRIDMDRWLTLPAAAPPSAEPAGKADAATDPKAASASMPAAPPFQLPKDVNGSLIFSAEAITYRNGVVRDAVLNADLANGELTISQLSGQFPGGSDLAVFGFVTAADGAPRFEGKLESTVSDLRGVLRWLGAEVEGVSPDRLRKMTLAARVVAAPTQAQLANIDMRFDSSRLTGGVTVAFTQRPSFGADISLDRLSLDGYLPKRPDEAAKGDVGAKAKAKAAGKPADKAAADAAKTPAAANPFQALNVLTKFDANLKARVESLEYQGDRIKDVSFNGTLYNGRLDIRRFSVAQAAGVSGTLSGALTGLESLPEAAGVTFQVRATDVPKALKFAGLEPPPPSKKVGTVTVNGRIDGKLLAPRFDVKIVGAGATATVKGQLDGMGLVPAAKGLSFRLRTADAPRLLALGGIDVPDAAKNLGVVNVSGSLDGNLLQPNVALSLKAAGGDLALQGPVNAIPAGDMFDFALKANHPDVAGLLKALGTGYRPAGKTGGLAVTGRLKGGLEALTLAGLDAKLGATILKGDVKVGLGGRRPDVSADIVAGAIVLDPFLPAQRTASLLDRPGGPAMDRAAIIPAAWPGGPSIPARRPDGRLILAAVPGQWSRDPIDLSGLAAIDGRLRLKS
ncbi:MAG: AsmA family protein, partial [Rhodospirillales bacterium]